MRLTAVPLPLVATLLLCSAASAGAAVRRARQADPARPAPNAREHVDGFGRGTRFDAAAGERAPVPLAEKPIRPHPAAPAAQDSHGRPAASWNQGSPQREVDRWTRILSRDPDTQTALGRLAQYERLIREALAARGIPEDFVALPIIESGLIPQATSRAGAAGIWQLMPATARAYGLEVSTWVDERRDPVRSTLAATRHLADLHEELGSWHLAAAAYNCGSSRLRQAVGQRRDDFAYWAGRTGLPAETRAYVPKLLAAVRLTREAARDPHAPTPEPLRYAEVVVPGGTHLSTVAGAQGVSVDTLARLNPHLVQQSTPPGRAWPVRIPPPRHR
jgi:soluble lytic murein transglycosylase-like protein